MIGDCRTAALISTAGSIDWLCLPRFDSPSVFNRLLDWQQGGYCTVRPQGPYTVHRYYRQDTAILVTEFSTDVGRVRVTDLMPVVSQQDRQLRLAPLRQLLRRIDGLEGTVAMKLVVKPRPGNGRIMPRFRARSHGLYTADMNGAAFFVSTDVPMAILPGELTGQVSVKRGESRSLWLSYAEEAPAVYPWLPGAADHIEETADYWTNWASRCTYRGPYRERAVRSALTLKLLTYAPSGAIVAAPTTSLPERIGGELNWDYRYCWLRDASFTAQSFFRLGFESEAIAFMHWLMHATTLTYPASPSHVRCARRVLASRVVASLLGRLPAFTAGPRGERRLLSQFQLDIYGELLDALLAYAWTRGTIWIAIHSVGSRAWAMWSAIDGLLPDHGMWELRTRPQHYVHSKVLCWVALDRAARLSRSGRDRLSRPVPGNRQGMRFAGL